MRVRDSDLEVMEQRVNALLRNVKVKVAHRYNYTAIDLTKPDGSIIDTLLVGLTKKEAYEILEAISSLLLHETLKQ